MSAGAPGPLRLFFAFWPDAPTRQGMLQASRPAIRECGGRPVVPANLHVTLAFLGQVGADRLDAVEEAGGRLAGGTLEFVFDRLAVWARPRVLVATAEDPGKAGASLAARLWDLLALQGFSRDPRPYRPHVTLARKVVTSALESSLEPVVWPVQDVALVRSVSAPAGVEYRVLARWPLRSA